MDYMRLSCIRVTIWTQDTTISWEISSLNNTTYPGVCLHARTYWRQAYWCPSLELAVSHSRTHSHTAHTHAAASLSTGHQDVGGLTATEASGRGSERRGDQGITYSNLWIHILSPTLGFIEIICACWLLSQLPVSVPVWHWPCTLNIHLRYQPSLLPKNYAGECCKYFFVLHQNYVDCVERMHGMRSNEIASSKWLRWLEVACGLLTSSVCNPQAILKSLIVHWYHTGKPACILWQINEPDLMFTVGVSNFHTLIHTHHYSWHILGHIVVCLIKRGGDILWMYPKCLLCQ